MLSGIIQAWYGGQPDRYRGLPHDTELLTCFLIFPKGHRPHPLTGFLLSTFYTNVKTRAMPAPQQSPGLVTRALTDIVYGYLNLSTFGPERHKDAIVGLAPVSRDTECGQSHRN